MKLRLIIDLSHNDGDGMHTNSRLSRIVDLPHGSTGSDIIHQFDGLCEKLGDAFEDQVDQLVALNEVAP